VESNASSTINIDIQCFIKQWHDFVHENARF
jgi:hypothetical protein